MATKKRVNITIDLETLRLADRAARRQKVSRSQLIRKAIRDAAAAQDRQFEAEARRKRQQRASETMDRLAQKAGKWPADQILRAARTQADGRDMCADEAQPERRRRAIDGITGLALHFGDWPAEQILRAARDRWQKPKA
jgi:hypothetical protein